MGSHQQPWFRGPKDVPPFSPFTVLTSHKQNDYHSLACFPWTGDSLSSLWGGVQDLELISSWKNAVKPWVGAIAVGATGCLCIYPKLATGKPLPVPLAEQDKKSDISNVAWAINSRQPLNPLIVCTVKSVVLIFDPTAKTFVGRLRGHGGPITSVSVHPMSPNLFCTTSRDFTTRIYDLSLTPVQQPNNMHWLPNTVPSLAGPAHGLHMCEPEGDGIGRCVAVMVGGRSGGHRGGVLCSAFHPSQPLLATGGMDRAVKIWRIPPAVYSQPEPPRLAREDKPLFTTDLIHKARVLSIHWLADDVLASCSARAYMRRVPNDPEETYWEEGTVTIWQWLGFNRFFPPNRSRPQKVMRGTASDWRNSESFKVLSAYHLPLVAERFHFYQSRTHDPMFLVPMGKTIRIFNISQFHPREPPKFPLDDIAALTSRLHLGDDERDADAKSMEDEEGQPPTDEGSGAEGSGTARGDANSTIYPPPAPLATLFDSVEGWEVIAQVSTKRGHDPPETPDVIACAMGFDGLALVGIGEKGTLYVWRLRK